MTKLAKKRKRPSGSDLLDRDFIADELDVVDWLNGLIDLWTRRGDD